MTTRAEFLRRAVLAGASTPFLLGANSPQRRRRRIMRRVGLPDTPANGRPNILFILTDDQPPHTVRSMPNAMRIGSGGLDLTDTAYVSIPICGPARVSLLTGTYPHNNGTRDNTNPSPYLLYRERHYPATDLLSRVDKVGYRVGFFGKFINDYGSARDSNDGRFVHPGCDRWQALVGSQGKIPYVVNKDGNIVDNIRQNHTPYFGEAALNFIENSMEASSGAAFFCYLNWTDPHWPATPFNAFLHTHDNESYSSPGTQEDDLSDKSEWSKSLERYGPVYHQERYEGIAEELEGVDLWVGRLLDALEAAGQLENTLIVFSSDNGYMLGEHGGLGTKSLPYEESARVPFLIRGPGIGPLPEGALASHLDITATILDAAVADMSNLDGRSLLSPERWRERLLVEHPGRGWYMLREGSDSYIELPSGETELYDLSSDPYENESLDDAPEAQDKKTVLAEKLSRVRVAKADELRAIEEE